MPTNTTFKCSRCESGPCYLITPTIGNSDVFGAALGDLIPRNVCPMYPDEEHPNWRLNLSPTVRMKKDWMVETLHTYVDEHYDELPEFIKDAAYGILIQPQNRSYMKELDLLHLMADDDRSIIDLEQEDLIKKALNKATKVEILNDVIPAAFAAGVIYAYIRLHSTEYDGMEDVDDVD